MDESSQTNTGQPENPMMNNTGDGDTPSRQHQQRCLLSAHRAPPNTPAESSVQQASLRKWRHSSRTASVSRRSSLSTIHGIRNLGSLDEEEKDGSTRINTDPAFTRICSLLTHLLTDASIAVGGQDAEENTGARPSLVFLDSDGTEESDAMSDADLVNMFVKESKDIKNNRVDSAAGPAMPVSSTEAEGGKGVGERGLYRDNLGGEGGEHHFARWSWAVNTHPSGLGGSRRRRSWSSRKVKGQSLFLELQQSAQANESSMFLLPNQDEDPVHDLWNHHSVGDVRESDNDSEHRQQDTITTTFDHNCPLSLSAQSTSASDLSSSWTPRLAPSKSPRRCASFPPNRSIEQIHNQEQQKQHTEELQRVIERVESELNQTVETIDGLTRDLVAVASRQQWVHMSLQRNYYQRLAQHHGAASAPLSQSLRRSSFFDSDKSSLVGTALTPRWTKGDAQAHERARSMDSWSEPLRFALSSYFLDEGLPFDCNCSNGQEDEESLPTQQKQDAMGVMSVQESMFLDEDDDIHPQDRCQRPSPGFFSGIESREESQDPLSSQRQSNRFSKSSSAYTLVDESMSPPTHPLSLSANASCRNSASSRFSIDSRSDHQKDDMDCYEGRKHDIELHGAFYCANSDQHWAPTIPKEATPEDFWVFLSSMILYFSKAALNAEAPISAPTPAVLCTPLSGMPTWTTAAASWGKNYKLLCTDLTPPKKSELLEQTTTSITDQTNPDDQEKQRLLMARTVMTTTFQLFSLLFWTLLFSIATMLLAPPLTKIARRRILYTMDHIIVELDNEETTDDKQEDDPTL